MRKVIALVLFIFQFIGIYATNDLDSLFFELDQTMKNRHKYDQLKENKINSIKELFKEPGISEEQIYHINNRLIAEFSAYSFDSTFAYIERNTKLAHQIANENYQNECKLHLAYLLSSSGRYKEAQDLLEQVNPKDLNKHLLIEYYNHHRKIYSDLDYISVKNESRKDYGELNKAYTDSVLPLLAKDSDEYLDILQWQFFSENKLNERKAIFKKRLERTHTGTKEYSLITFQEALTSGWENNEEMQKKYLTLSAISDIKGSRKDNASLTILAQIIYEEGNIDLAYKYIKFAFEDAVYYNSRLRFIQIAQIFSSITESYQIKTAKQKTHLKTLVFAISISLAGLLFALVLIYGQMKKLRKTRNDLGELNLQMKNANIEMKLKNNELRWLNSELSQSNLTKELYISNFMTICSDFIDKLDKYRLKTRNLVLSKDYNTLIKMTKNSELIEEEIREFYVTFDKTFLNIYPNFFDQVNNLLLEGQQIELKKGEILNTELRILALIRLGIKDSAKIAQLLRYSVNTIYNYRVKIRDRANVPRDEFEEQISKLGSLEFKK